MKPIDTEHTTEKFFKLSYKANPKIPFIIEDLECRQTKYGYGIFTTRDLKPGDIISIEKPSFTTTFKAAQYIRCCNCFKTAMMNLLPCLKSASLMFCSTQCRESIYNRYENSEEVLWEHEGGKIFNHMKGLYDLFEAFGVEKLNDYLKSNDQKTLFDYDWSTMTELQQKEARFKCLLSFNFNSDDADKSDRTKKNQYELATDAFSKLALCGLKYGIFVEASDTSEKVAEGFSLFNISNIIKHSCQANTYRIHQDQDQVVYVSRSVKAGEELTIDSL